MSESWIPEKPVLLKEIEDLASVFGEGHIAVQQLQYSLSVRFQREGLFEDAEATQIEEIEVLLKDSGLIQYRRNLEPLEAPTTQNSASKPLPLAIKMPQSMNSSPVLHRIGLFAGRFHPLMARSMDNLVNIFIHQSRWTEAEWLCIHVREVFLCLDGEHHLNTLHSTFKLGQIYWEQGRWNEAERTYRYALDLCKYSLGEEHWQTLEIWEKLIQLYQNGDYHGKDTEELLTSYLNVELKKSKINEPERYSRVKKSATLEEQFQKMARKISISESPDMSVVADMGKIAILYSQQRRFKEAEEMLHQLIEICEKGLPQDHLETLTFMHQLAKLWIGQKHWNAAESLLKEVVERRNRVLGKRAIASLDAANDLAATYLNLNRLREGGILLQETLAAQKEVHGENHPKTLITLIKLAFLYSKCGKLKDAVELLEDTLERQKGVLGEEHRNVFDSSSFLAQLYIAEERYDEAETLCRSLIVRQEKLPKPEYPMVLDSMLGLATCFAAQKRYRDATLVVERYSTISTQIFGDTSKQALIGLLHLGVLYYREERWEEGKKVHQAALNMAKAELGLDDQLTKEIARGLAFGNKAKWPES